MNQLVKLNTLHLSTEEWLMLCSKTDVVAEQICKFVCILYVIFVVYNFPKLMWCCTMVISVTIDLYITHYILFTHIF